MFYKSKYKNLKKQFDRLIDVCNNMAQTNSDLIDLNKHILDSYDKLLKSRDMQVDTSSVSVALLGNEDSSNGSE